MPENEQNCPLDSPDNSWKWLGKNLLIIDGNCGFCKRWALYFQQIALNRFEIITAHEAAPDYPQISPEQFAQSVKFIDTGGVISEGADACYRALSLNQFFKFLIVLYRKFPPFAEISEIIYRFIAENRMVFSRMTTILWGNNLVIPQYYSLRTLFLRGLGLIYLIAFLSLLPQMMGLFGSQGVSPISGYTQMVDQVLARQGEDFVRYWYIPSIFWIGQSDVFILTVVWIGLVAAILLVLNFAPAISASICFILYLSICAVGEPFMSFQWDALLLEVGFLAIIFAPWQCFPPRSSAVTAPSRMIVWLYRWLLFRLMFASGVVKLSSGDVTWSDWTALNYHYFTQPLPNPLAWYAHQLPEWFHKFSVGSMFFVELILPFFIFAPRRLRFAAGALLAFLQFLIIVTGNYTFFNYLSLLLVMMCWDDQALKSFFRWFGKKGDRIGFCVKEYLPENFLKRRIIIPVVALLIVWMSIPLLLGSFRIQSPQWLSVFNRYLGQFRIVNGYGLFAMMTTQRLEIIIEGSQDGMSWLPFEFKYKPGNPSTMPPQIAPFQPRLDWQMWFAALGNYQGNPWLINLQGRLLQENQPVRKLLGSDPFAGKPPRYIRAVVYEYRFTTPEERAQTADWWSRKLLGNYSPVLEWRGQAQFN